MMLPLSLLPLGLVLGGGIAALMLESFWPGRKTLAGLLSLAFVALAGVVTLSLWHSSDHSIPKTFFRHALVVDRLALGLYLLLFICAGASILTSIGYLEREGLPGEYFALLLLALSGMMVMVSSNDLLSIFLGLEIMALSTYVLVGMQRHDPQANEAALKYFYLGAFSAGIFLYGIALTYGALGTTLLDTVGVGRVDTITSQLADPQPGALPLAGLGAVFMLVGLVFKVAAVPFHGWVPDVYQGAPSPLVGFMAAAVKAAAYAALLRFLHGYIDLKDQWGDILWWLAVLTMFTGNAFALVQSNIKRMLAYSSIAHSGFILIGLAAFGDDPANQAGAAVLYYLFAYGLTTLGAFGCVSWLSLRGEQRVQIEDYQGLGHRYPFLGLVFAICLLSLTGIPPTAGFFGKYYLLAAAVSQGYLSLAVIGILNSILAIYYYLRVVVFLYLREPVPGKVEGAPPAAYLALFYTAVAVIWAGLGPTNLFQVVPGLTPLLDLVQKASEALWQV